MRREVKTRPVVGVLILAVLLAAPTLVTSTRRYGPNEDSAREIVQEVNFEDDIANSTWTDGGGVWAWVQAPWLALLVPFVLGLGLLQATLFHTAACCALATLKAARARPGGWCVTAAAALGAACGAQLLLVAGLGLTALRMHLAMRHGAFASATGLADFLPGQQVWEPLQPFLWATPVLIVCYWVMLSILCKIEERKKRRKEERQEKLVQGDTDISIIKITQL